MSNLTANTSAAEPISLPTRERIEALASVIDAMSKRPVNGGLDAWMRSKGFPPETSSLVLPGSWRPAVGPFLPRYVTFSDAVTAPLLMHNLLTPKDAP